jgi:hypothetical protein
MSAKTQIPTTTEEQNPIGNLKPTPKLPMDFQTKINAIKRLESINANLIRYEATKELLSNFKLEEGVHSAAILTIKDSGYSGAEFKTANVAVIKDVIEFLAVAIDERIKGITKEISAFELPKI